MQPADSFEQKKVDPRVYLGILVFRWKVIVACFLYCLLGGVLYLEFAPKEYETVAGIGIYRDPSTRIDSMTYHSVQAQTHVGLLRSPAFQARVIEQLRARWLPRLGGDSKELWLPLSVTPQWDGPNLQLSLRIRNTHPAYARAYLRQAIKDFQTQRELAKQESYGSAARILEEELARITEQIRTAEDDAIEFQRVNQMEYVLAKGKLELGYLNMLVSRQEQLSTEKWMLEVQYPKLKGQNADVMRDALAMTRDTGRISAAVEAPAEGAATTEGGAAAAGSSTQAVASVQAGEKESDAADGLPGWQSLRLRLARLEKQRADLLVYTQPENPKLRTIDDEITRLKQELQLQADLVYARMKERVSAIDMQLDALEEAQRRWRNSYLLASKKGSEYRHLQQAVTRLEGIYAQLYSRLNDLRVDREIKAEHFNIITQVQTGAKPAWPDPLKILITALVAGIGSGFAMALLAFFFDDKVQSVSDVEATIGVPFLGGVPFWVHSDLANRMRPIVSDEHRSGAAEAYRALRTNVLNAVAKAGKKVVLITSADSKEGKTLTALNLALMVAKTGKRVLLLDMDLRRGVLHKSFELERTPGIVEALSDQRPLSSVIQETPYKNLWFAAAGSSAEKNTSELLHGTDLEHFIGEVVDQYDYVILDSAPVLRVTDTVILAGCPLVCVIYVAHANRTSKPVIRYSLDMLGDVHVIGMIVNSIEMHRISSLYYAYQYPNYAYYSYAYRYGYNYDLYDEHGRHVSYGPFGVARRAVMRWFRSIFEPAE